MFQWEGDYWWFVARRRLARALLQAHLPEVSGRMLDAGCGTGALLSELHAQGVAVGVDVEREALRLTRQRGALTVVQARLEALPFASACFQVAFALDVLEHLPDERPALRELHRVLQAGGYLIVSVPAYSWLWSKHDVALAHYRRYTARMLQARLCEAGFQVRRLSYALGALLPAIALDALARSAAPRRARRNGHSPAPLAEPRAHPPAGLGDALPAAPSAAVRGEPRRRRAA